MEKIKKHIDKLLNRYDCKNMTLYDFNSILKLIEEAESEKIKILEDALGRIYNVADAMHQVDSTGECWTISDEALKKINSKYHMRHKKNG